MGSKYGDHPGNISVGITLLINIQYRQPVFGNWGFNIERGDPIQKKWDMIPDDTDILITHGPPIGTFIN